MLDREAREADVTATCERAEPLAVHLFDDRIEPIGEPRAGHHEGGKGGHRPTAASGLVAAERDGIPQDQGAVRP